MSAHRRAGVSLVELLVVLVLLGVLASIGGLNLTVFRAPVDPLAGRLRRAERQAVTERRAVLLRTDSVWIRVLPDGRILEAPIAPEREESHAP